MYLYNSFNEQEAQLLLGWPTVLPHKRNANPKPITNWFLNFAHHCRHVPVFN